MSARASPWPWTPIADRNSGLGSLSASSPSTKQRKFCARKRTRNLKSAHLTYLTVSKDTFYET
jgi:hypothetical protein